MKRARRTQSIKEVWNQGISRVDSFWALRENLLQASLLASGDCCNLWCALACRYRIPVLHICKTFSLYVFTSSSLYVRLCVQISPFYKDTSPIGLGCTLMTQFYLNYLCKDPFSKYSCILRHQELALHQVLLCGHNSAHSRVISREGRRSIWLKHRWFYPSHQFCKKRAFHPILSVVKLWICKERWL